MLHGLYPTPFFIMFVLLSSPVHWCVIFIIHIHLSYISTWENKKSWGSSLSYCYIVWPSCSDLFLLIFLVTNSNIMISIKIVRIGLSFLYYIQIKNSYWNLRNEVIIATLVSSSINQLLWKKEFIPMAEVLLFSPCQ